MLPVASAAVLHSHAEMLVADTGEPEEPAAGAAHRARLQPFPSRPGSRLGTRAIMNLGAVFFSGHNSSESVAVAALSSGAALT